MQILYFFFCIILGSITSAWPHPGDVLEAVPDLGSVFDIFSWPTTVEDVIASSDSAECPADGTLGTQADSDTIEGPPLASAYNDLLDPGLFSGLQTVTGPREKAPPCGPGDSHHLVCCLDEYGAPGFLMNCRGGKCN